ncbi:MAG TPA: hypothetical protein VMW94_06890 [Actinomycetes bacterium]|nr:hypothetical protein [Actinomycetes bacterium]
MAEQPGIDLMRSRIERASRQAPPSRRPVESADPDANTTVADTAPAAAQPVVPTPVAAVPVKPPRARPASRASRRADPVHLGADLPPVNLAIRVRKPLDDRLAEVIHQLRQEGVRTSKVELIEMLLWEMPDDQPGALRERLRQFRDWAPRGTSAPLGPEERLRG